MIVVREEGWQALENNTNKILHYILGYPGSTL
jgi:hypothetical protein